MLIAVGIDWDGRRQILGVEVAGRESRSAWKDFLVSLKVRGLPSRACWPCSLRESDQRPAGL